MRVPVLPTLYNPSWHLTATRRAYTLSMTKPLSLRAPRAFGGGSSLLSR